MTVTKEMAADLNWWSYTAPRLNNKCLISPPIFKLDAQYMVDGRGKLATGEPPAIGGLNFLRQEFFSLSVSSQHHEAPIHVVEAVALLVAARVWVEHLPRDSVSVVASDSMPVVDSVNHGKPRDPSLQATTRLL